MHKTKSYQSTLIDAEEGKLTKYWDNGNMLIFLECHCPFLRNVSLEEQQGLMCIVGKSCETNSWTPNFVDHCCAGSLFLWDLALCKSFQSVKWIGFQMPSWIQTSLNFEQNNTWKLYFLSLKCGFFNAIEVQTFCPDFRC